MTNIAILLLAAGASSRMRGRDKLLERVDDQPLLSLLVSRAQATGLPVLVSLPQLDHPRARCIGTAQPVVVPDATEGMSASIRRGIAALDRSIDGAMVLPADMPEITTEDLNRVVHAFQGPEGAISRAMSATPDGTLLPGHPVVFPRRCFAALQQLRGDQGARHVLSSEEILPVTLPASHALIDLDTPEDWATWRAAR